MKGMDCARCGAALNRLFCAYCGAFAGSVRDAEKEVEALEQFHGALRDADEDAVVRLLRGGSLPTHAAPLVEAGLRCLPLIADSDISAEPSASALQRLMAVTAKLKLLPQDGETAKAVFNFESKIAASNPRGRQMLVMRLLALAALAGFAGWFITSRIPKPIDPDFPVSMEAQAYFEGGDGKLRPLENGMVLNSRDNYCLYLRPGSRSYAYVFQADAAGSVSRLFPNREFNQASNPLQAGRDYWIPDGTENGKTKFLFLDATRGIESVYFLASMTRLAEIEALKETDLKSFTTALQGLEAGGAIATMGAAGTRTGVSTGKVRTAEGNRLDSIGKRLEAKSGFYYKVSFVHQ
jgi:hypothetical protein